MRYSDEALRELAYAVVEQTARDYAQALIQYRREVGSAEFNRRWLVEFAEFYAEVDGETVARRIERRAAEFVRVSAKVAEDGKKRRCPVCRTGTIARRRNRNGTICVRCGLCFVTITEAKP